MWSSLHTVYKKYTWLSENKKKLCHSWTAINATLAFILRTNACSLLSEGNYILILIYSVLNFILFLIAFPWCCLSFAFLVLRWFDHL